jgi:uncharacterized Zn-finger protein
MGISVDPIDALSVVDGRRTNTAALDRHQIRGIYERNGIGHKRYACRDPDCSQDFAHEKDEARHWLVEHSSSSAQTCPYCGDKYQLLQNMAIHMNAKHKPQLLAHQAAAKNGLLGNDNTTRLVEEFSKAFPTSTKQVNHDREEGHSSSEDEAKRVNMEKELGHKSKAVQVKGVHQNSEAGKQTYYKTAAKSNEGFYKSLPGSTSPKAPRRTKADVPKACQNCKKAYLSCDITRPCNRCITTRKEVCAIF